jgi:cyclopropane-fatty-acyl-phospholipid synthase
MFAPLKFVFDYVVERGNLAVFDSRGEEQKFGDGSGPEVAVRLGDRRLEYSLALNPTLALGEAYMQGRLLVERGTIYDFLKIMLANAEARPFPRWMSLVDIPRGVIKRLHQLNSIGRARANVAHHYNIDRSIYDLFLDSDKQYSCAYFIGQCGLDEAQLHKKRHVAAKLALSHGQRVLDIGSGWGGLALYLAKVANTQVTGITLSEEQLKVARQRAFESGLEDSVHFEALDYRSVQGSFDRIVSVGMFEHVEVGYYDIFFRKVSELLSDDGVALIHFIARFDVPAATNAFITKYIFPGGHIPALSEVLPAIERSGLLLTDMEILRLHYAETLKHWRARFLRNRQTAETLLGPEFCRMWEFYLAASEAAFRYQNLMVAQIQLTKHQGALPLTRDYIPLEEQRLASIERSWPQTRAAE